MARALREIDAAPLEPGADGMRALSLVSAQNLLEPARIAVSASAQDGRIDYAGGIGGYQLATLHAFNIDEPQAVAGVDWYGDSPTAGHSVALFAGSEREDAWPLDGGRLRRSWPDSLVAGKNQHVRSAFPLAKVTG